MNLPSKRGKNCMKIDYTNYNGLHELRALVGRSVIKSGYGGVGADLCVCPFAIKQN